MKMKFPARLLAVAFLFAALTSCGAAKDAPAAVLKPSKNAAAAFSVNLLQSAVAQGGENTLVSPLSAFLALSLVANGADENTLAQFESLLCDSGTTLIDRNEANKALLADLLQPAKDKTLTMVSSIWSDKGFPILPQFLEVNKYYYDAGLFSADLQGTGTTDAINKWVSDETKGLIPQMVDDIDADAVMILLNTVYFKAQWDPFGSFETGDFKHEDGKTTQAVFMTKHFSGVYVSGKKCKGVLYPYGDGKTAFLCLLPDKGTTAKKLLSSFDENTVSTLVASAKSQNMNLQLPKFSAACDIDLKGILPAMGMSDAFDPLKADFKKMSEAEQLYISAAKQKANLQIYKEGTTASAATEVEMSKSLSISMPDEPLPKEKTIRFNRPFVYAVVDLKTNLPLFFGEMDHPTEADADKK